MYSANGAPKGANVTSGQGEYDLIFKDVVIRSENRNKTVYPNPNNYSVTFRNQITKIYRKVIVTTHCVSSYCNI